MENTRYWEDLSDQEKDLAVAMGTEGKFPHRPEGQSRVGETYKVNLPKSRDEVPDQAKELWDLFHK